MVSQFVGNVDPEVDAAGEDARATSDAWRKLRGYGLWRGPARPAAADELARVRILPCISRSYVY
jgi:hypothetical protein